MRSVRDVVALASVALLGWSAAGAARGDAAPGVDPLAGETIVAKWNEATLEAIREGGFQAPLAARALAIVDSSMYDAWAAYDDRAIGTDGTSRLRRPRAERRRANVERAIAVAAFTALRDVVPIPVADVTLAQTGQTIGLGDEPERVGIAAARAVLAAREHDGANQFGDLHAGAYADPTGYRPTNSANRIEDPSHWQPLLVYDGAGRFVTQHFLVPQWGDVRPFAIDAAALAATIPAPPRYGDDRYGAEVAEILDISAHLTDEQKTVAEYWADGMMTDSPPGHWVRFGIWVSHRDRHDVARDAKMFFALSNALLDASIACWRVKRTYDSVRPITAVHVLYAGKAIDAWAGPGKGTRRIVGDAWQPYQSPSVITPAFPEYISGHSTFSAAAAEVLRRFTGSDRFGASFVQRAKTSTFEAGVPARDVRLAWPTFSSAAAEAGISRRYGGIHFAAGDLWGRRLGRAVGAIAYEKAMTFVRGTAVASQRIARR